MRIFEFLDVEFTKASQKAGQAQGLDYSLMLAGRMQALHALISGLRTFAKYLSIPVILTQYFLVQARIIKAPISPLLKSDDNLTKIEKSSESQSPDPQGSKENLGAEA